MKAPLGNFAEAWKALDRPDLVPPVVIQALEAWPAADEVLIVDTDPDLADTANFCAAYDVPLEASANCVVVAGKRGQNVTLAGCVVLATTKADVNGAVRKLLDARKASFAAMDVAVAETGMEYGGITPIGLPGTWPLLIDTAVVDVPYVIVGSGRRRGKILLPGKLLAGLPDARVEPIAG